MSNRVYILIAIVILIASPIIVNMLSTALPPPGSASNAGNTMSAQDEPEQADEEPQVDAPPPPEGEIGSTEPVFDVQPSMDTSGITPAPIAGEPDSQSSPPPASEAPREPETIAAPDQEAAPPPPPRPEIPASLNH